jgi:hypothetical protein
MKINSFTSVFHCGDTFWVGRRGSVKPVQALRRCGRVSNPNKLYNE